MNAGSRRLGWFALAAWVAMGGGMPANAQGISLGDALDAPDWTWTTNASGFSMWQIESWGAHDGVDLVRGYADSFGYASLETTVTGPGAISFWWNFQSTMQYAGSFDFSINGELQVQYGASAWKNQVFVLGEGQQTLRWTVVGPQVFGFTSSGDLDEIALLPLAVQLSVRGTNSAVVTNGTPTVSGRPARISAKRS